MALDSSFNVPIVGIPPDTTIAAYDPTTYQLVYSTISFSNSPIFAFQAKLGRYPGNNKQWWVAKADADDPTNNITAGQFLPELLETFFSGNNRAPRGHFVLNQFRKDRSAVSGVPSIPVEETNERPNSVTFFSGRAWFGCQSTVYYSQILDSSDASKAGLCYQEADPTAEDISDLIATDGGVVPIPEADHIEALYPLGNGVLVFAQNGVWFVSGGDQSFSALNISVSKVSPIGTKSPQTIVETDGTIFWWSEIGIQAIQQASGQFGPIPGRFGNTNIAEQTIQTFYNSIGSTSKHRAKGVFDPRNNTITWLFNSEDSSDFSYDSALIYDITLQAFYPWKFSDISSYGGPRISGIFLDSGYLESAFSEPITTISGLTITANTQPITQTLNTFTIRPSNVYYLCEYYSFMSIAAPNSLDYVDWKNFDNVGVPYDSYVLSGYELMNDAMRDKQLVYLYVYFNRTEDNLGNNQSSCKMVTRWDWAGESNQLKWSREFEAYRPRTLNLTDVVVSKNKVRGNGRAVQFRLGTNEPGKTFDLLGWSVEYSGNTQP